MELVPGVERNGRELCQELGHFPPGLEEREGQADGEGHGLKQQQLKQGTRHGDNCV